ncbi:MAG TPA: hypothetical protein VK506_16455 [Conexibacter sp.]|nr:hypothetical protein [Conexibacter sp.]
MICTLTARRLKPGAYDAFRAAWDPGDPPPEVIGRWKQVYHTRDVADPDVVISFGMFDGSLDELREIQAQAGGGPPAERVGEHVEEVLLDGSYEVVEALVPADFGA